MQVPRATYRLQFNEHFRLADALALVPYLHELGVSHIYASPFFKAAPHSAHGYDVCDFSRLNPEIGTEKNLEKLVAALRESKMGLVLDIVPNHMGVATPENFWWWDILKNGRASKFANHFDVDWESNDPELYEKILVPVLGGNCNEVIEKGELKVEKKDGEFVLRYFENEFPLAPESVSESFSAENANANSATLGQLIQRQHYRLSSWSDANERLNYRRFFAVSHLAGLRVEDDATFNDVHRLLRKWLANGWLAGLRVDHPDGLRDPKKYLRQLRELAPEQWIVVEKILQPQEQLPASWPVQGTTGYDFLNQINGVFVDSAGEKVLNEFYSEFTGETASWAEIVLNKKKRVLETLFATEISRLTEMLLEIAALHSMDKTFSREQLREAIVELAATLLVYRTYIRPDDGQCEDDDFYFFKQASDMVAARRRDLSPELFDYLNDLIALKFRGELENEFVARFQQLTGPAMAKGVEDTAFYCFNRFISLNEVGGNPGDFGVSLEKFHEFCRRQKNEWPASMLATSTHDTKRAEDVRAQLNLLSEIPGEWTAAVKRWSVINAGHHRGNWPDRNTEYFCYQTLVGAWPISSSRILSCMEKAGREAGRCTTWTAPNKEFENALWHFIVESLRDPEFMLDFKPFAARIAEAACVNSLAQTLVKLTAPGVPDIYQGCELFDFSLVDPDNRRPIDFDLRRQLLAEIKNLRAEEIWKRRGEGVAKLWLIRKVLKLREQKKAIFAGDYEPLFAWGEKAKHVIAFIRGNGVISVVPRFLLRLGNWADTVLPLSPGNWRDEFTGAIHAGEIPIEKLFEKFPVALLVKKGK